MTRRGKAAWRSRDDTKSEPQLRLAWFLFGSGRGNVIVVPFGTGESGIVISDGNLRPVFLSACVIYVGKSVATQERRSADALDAVADRDTRQFIAIPERIFSDARDAIGDRDTRQSIAIIERIFSDARDAVGDRDARQFPAT